eukprot:Hpha_TRINITY_DN15679_c0_g1::TRINITY_DN15679_c0_g1_i1::g.97360::m.97360
MGGRMGSMDVPAKSSKRRRCARALVREGDSVEVVHAKQMLFPICVFLITFSLPVLAFNISGTNFIALIGTAITIVGCALFIGGARFSTIPLHNLITMLLVMTAITFVLLDMNAAATSSTFRSWVFIILVLDGALVFKRRQIPGVLIPCTVAYLAADAVESTTRYGLYEVARWGKDSGAAVICGCATPPCANSVNAAVVNFVAVVTVFLLDFYLTRGFASGLQIQLSRVESSIKVAAEVAAALARYDISTAEKAINEGKEIPEEMGVSLLRLLSNLRSYRDYLPDSLLNYDDNSDCGVVAPPISPGEGTGDVAMLFTDIQSSTDLWEAYPEEMHEALKMHNTTLREVAKEHQGYEVKIIGDALMLAFGNAYEAMT